MKAVLTVILIIGYTVWQVSANQKKKDLEEKKELERSRLARQKQVEHEKTLNQERINQERLQREKSVYERRLNQEKLQLERREEEYEEKKRQKQESEKRRQKILQDEKVAVESADIIKFRFHFNFFYEEELKAIIVVFNEKSDWLDYKTIIRGSKEYSQELYQYLRGNAVEMEQQLGLLERVYICLVPKYSDSSHLEKVSEWVQSNKEQISSQTLLSIDSNGGLAGGEIKELLTPNLVSLQESNLDEISQLMSVLDYFVLSKKIVVYFKNESACHQTLEKITSSFQTVVDFCQSMKQVKMKIEEAESFSIPMRLLLMPISARNEDEAAELMSLMTTTNRNLLEKLLVVIDEQNQVSDGALVHNIPTEMLANINGHQQKNESSTSTEIDLKDDSVQKQEGSNNFNVYEWFIQETGEIFFVGVGYGNQQPSIRQNDLFKRVREKHESNYRFVGKQLTIEKANELKIQTMGKALDNGNVLANIQVPLGYLGGLATSADRTDIGTKKFHYLEAPQIVGNIVETHYQLLESVEMYDSIDMQSLKKTVVPDYALNLEKSLYFRRGSGDIKSLIEKLKIEIQEKVNSKIYKTLAKSADSVILTNDPTPVRVKDLHDKGYKVFHMLDVVKFLNIDLEQIAQGFEG